MPPSRQFPRYSGSLSFEEAAAALSWLAGFHAFFWGEAPEGLWWQGTFWHLDTRREEFEGIAWRELKDVAFGVGSSPSGPRVEVQRSPSPQPGSLRAQIPGFCPGCPTSIYIQGGKGGSRTATGRLRG